METVHDINAKAYKAVSVYSKTLLSIYDVYVFKCVSPIFFRCPSKLIVEFYINNVSKNHLEVGAGTGFLLKKCRASGIIKNLSLLDLSENCLEVTKKNIKPIDVTTYKANILEPLPLQNRQFKSIGLNFVLHCVPGNFKAKGLTLLNLGDYLTDDGVIFGSTAIYDTEQNIMAKLVMNAYNKKGIFNNRQDKKEELEEVLRSGFNNVVITQIGNVVFFKASNRKS
ncbi:class I SAM-dependent methyltransferase [Colwellia sp. Bg11-28]|uniref:class I SAM-dependent methyltransferase n=1 Tax=Colwellia sp. Bg11-28 TaxID=2058305 RepID=UPI000C31C6BF|nr:class I SAM-dependent methyltransferase [Colwellia sp. Bg11-28]PKH87616.1 methyltransferase type 12 [Colwellia sp. Bg11-28]